MTNEIIEQIEAMKRFNARYGRKPRSGQHLVALVVDEHEPVLIEEQDDETGQWVVIYPSGPHPDDRREVDEQDALDALDAEGRDL